MHPSFENLAIIDTPSLHASLMDIHHNTSLRSILEDDYISSAFKTHIPSCLSKGVRLWFIVKPFICSFYITHFIFSSMLHFCFNLIQPSTSSLFTYECGHGLDAFGMHLTHCLFGGQQIATHDAIRNACMSLLEKMGTLYGKSRGTPLHQVFDCEPIFT